MKKIICYLLFITLIITSCIGCGNKTSEPDKEVNKVEDTETTQDTDSDDEIPSNESVEKDDSTEDTSDASDKSEPEKDTNKTDTNKTDSKDKNDTTSKPSSSGNQSTQHTHKYSQKVTKPTCTEHGYTTYTCSCGNSYEDNYISAKGHTEVIDQAVAATLTTTGLTTGKHCSSCGMIFVKQEVTPKVEIIIHRVWMENPNAVVCAGDTLTFFVEAEFANKPRTVQLFLECTSYSGSGVYLYAENNCSGITSSNNVYALNLTIDQNTRPGTWNSFQCWAYDVYSGYICEYIANTPFTVVQD